MIKPWEHLRTEAYHSRYAMAAYFLKDCPSIIEIGGSQLTTSIDNFVDKSIKVILCDPALTEDSRSGNPICIKEKYQEVDFSHYIRGPQCELCPSPYGLCILGLDGRFQHPDQFGSSNFLCKPQHDNPLQKLISGSKRTVLEIPTGYRKSVPLFNNIIEDKRNNVIIDISLDFLRCAKVKSYRARRLVVIEN